MALHSHPGSSLIRMGYAEDLLEQAKHLANRDPTKPKQASLRRSISAAYYGLFHLLTWQASDRFAPSRPKNLQKLWQRAFAHNEMKIVCKAFASANLPAHLRPLAAGPLSKDLTLVANAFVELQEARHWADYDFSQPVSRQDAINQLEKAENAFQAWNRVWQDEDAQVFLSALLLSRHWTK